MPIVHQIEHLSSKIAIWEINESISTLENLAALNEQDLLTYLTFKNDNRRKEYLTVRALLKTLFPNEKLSIYYDEHGKPHLKQQSISISHSKNFVAIMIGHFKAGGIDIETMSERILRLSQKFVNATEREFVGDSPSIETLQIIWGAKEILYKIHSIGDLDFKKDLLVNPFQTNSAGQLTAEIRKKGFERSYGIYYEKFQHFMISWGMDHF